MVSTFLFASDIKVKSGQTRKFRITEKKTKKRIGRFYATDLYYVVAIIFNVAYIHSNFKAKIQV